MVTAQYTYEPFGGTTATGDASANPSKYTGREDDGTGLYYYRARYYSPTLQRFISEDPIGFAGGDVNVFAYVGNSPVMQADPFGLATFARPDQYGRLTFGPPPTGGRKDRGSGGGLGATGLIAACSTTALGTGALVGVGVLGVLALYIAMNPPKAVPITCDYPTEPVPTKNKDDDNKRSEECVKKCLHLMPSPSGDIQTSEFGGATVNAWDC